MTEPPVGDAQPHPEHDAANEGVLGPELFFGLVAPVGTDLEVLTHALTVALHDVAYTVDEIRLSELLDKIDREVPLRRQRRDARYQDYMDAGDSLRKTTGAMDALAVLAVREVGSRRKAVTGKYQRPRNRVGYVFRSLKTPEEVDTLRNIYGGGFFLISAYAPLEVRREKLIQDIAFSYERRANPEDEQRAETIIGRDENDGKTKHGQNVRDAFPKGDFFVDLSESEQQIQRAVDRFIKLVFGFEFYTPTRDECGMFHARSAALRSAELGRQVGAAITTANGDLVAVGGNELPVAGGGQVWAEDFTDETDPRDWARGVDSNDQMKEHNLKEVLSILQQKEMLSATWQGRSPDELLEACAPLMKPTRMMNATEFGRAVHAEMAAITSAADRGVSVHAHTLYTTTFPCHNCARHVISAGIRRVVYVEPYPKSLARQFHQEALELDSPRMSVRERLAGDWLSAESRQVMFEPFVGIAPRAFIELFGMAKRKIGTKMVDWDGQTSVPRSYFFPQHLSYFDKEWAKAERLLLAMGND